MDFESRGPERSKPHQLGYLYPRGVPYVPKWDGELRHTPSGYAFSVVPTPSNRSRSCGHGQTRTPIRGLSTENSLTFATVMIS